MFIKSTVCNLYMKCTALSKERFHYHYHSCMQVHINEPRCQVKYIDGGVAVAEHQVIYLIYSKQCVNQCD